MNGEEAGEREVLSTTIVRDKNLFVMSRLSRHLPEQVAIQREILRQAQEDSVMYYASSTTQKNGPVRYGTEPFFQGLRQRLLLRFYLGNVVDLGLRTFHDLAFVGFVRVLDGGIERPFGGGEILGLHLIDA